MSVHQETSINEYTIYDKTAMCFDRNSKRVMALLCIYLYLVKSSDLMSYFEFRLAVHCPFHDQTNIQFRVHFITVGNYETGCSYETYLLLPSHVLYKSENRKPTPTALSTILN